MAKKKMTPFGKFTIYMIAVIFITLGIIKLKENGLFDSNPNLDNCKEYQKVAVDRYGYISGITVNLRSSPDTSCGKVIFQLGHQEKIKIIARTVELDTISSTSIKDTIDYWYEVFVYKEDKNFVKGWVFGGLISTNSKEDEEIEELQSKIARLEKENYNLGVKMSKIIQDNSQKNQIIRNNNEWIRQSNQKSKDKQNLSSLVKLRDKRIYGKKNLGFYRVKNARVTIINNSTYYIDNVYVKVKYVKRNGKINYQKYFNISIPRNSTTTYTALPNKMGMYMDIEIQSIKCSALN